MAQTPGSIEAPYLGYSGHTYVADLDSWYPGIPTQVSFAWGGGITVGAIGAPMVMEFGWGFSKASISISPSGSISAQLLKNGVNVSGAAPLTITSGTVITDSTLAGWTKTFAAGDTLQINVLSVTTATAFVVSLGR